MTPGKSVVGCDLSGEMASILQWHKKPGMLLRLCAVECKQRVMEDTRLLVGFSWHSEMFQRSFISVLTHGSSVLCSKTQKRQLLQIECDG